MSHLGQSIDLSFSCSFKENSFYSYTHIIADYSQSINVQYPLVYRHCVQFGVECHYGQPPVLFQSFHLVVNFDSEQPLHQCSVNYTLSKLLETLSVQQKTKLTYRLAALSNCAVLHSAARCSWMVSKSACWSQSGNVLLLNHAKLCT